TPQDTDAVERIGSKVMDPKQLTAAGATGGEDSAPGSQYDRKLPLGEASALTELNTAGVTPLIPTQKDGKEELYSMDSSLSSSDSEDEDKENKETKKKKLKKKAKKRK
ncbi:hypothetical protein DKP78_16935, partial [Enterococcus faecium]